MKFENTETSMDNMNRDTKGSEKGFDLNGLCKTAHKIEQCVNTVTMLVRCSAEMHCAAKAYVKYVTERTNETKCLFASELADVVVSCMIVAAHEGIDIEKAIEDCVEKNRKRAEGMGGKK
jgi:NTP pyrophosphatase (non-canonical NTP hydrolase)